MKKLQVKSERSLYSLQIVDIDNQSPGDRRKACEEAREKENAPVSTFNGTGCVP